MNTQSILLSLFFFCTSMQCFANQVDSLLSMLEEESNPTVRADYLLKIAKSTYEQSHDDYLNYSQKALAETNQPAFNDDTLKMKVINNVGCAYSEINETKKANKYFFDAAELAQKINDQRYLSNLYNNIGLTYGNGQEYDKAIEFHLKSLKIKEERNDSLGVSISYTNIGAIYYSLKDYTKAKEYFEKSFMISKVIDDEEGLAFGYTNLADVFFAEERYPEALSYYNNYLEMVTAMKYNHSILYGHKKIGEIHTRLDDLEKAAPHLEKAYEMAIAYNYTWELTNICLQYATLKKQLGDYGAALKYAKDALDYFPNSSSKEKLATIHQTISEIYELQGNNSMALRHLKNHLIEQDSALQKENMETFAEMESKYQLELKENENHFLKKQHTLNEKIISQRTVLATMGFVVVVILILLVFWLYRMKEAKHQLNMVLERKVLERTQHLETLNQKLGLANEELERFFYITSHDLKEPLRNIMSFSNLAKRGLKTGEYDKVEEHLGYVEKGTSQMSTLMQGIMDFFSTGKSDSYKMLPLETILKNAKKELSMELQNRHPQFDYKYPTSFESLAFPQPLIVVFKNIIENGIRFNENENPIFNINLTADEKHFYFSIKDNGIGIPDEYHQHVFEMFKRLHSREKFTGSGIGLSICKKILRQLNGDIKVEKSGSEGTTIIFWVSKTECQPIEKMEIERSTLA